jgi:hypothetical protein
MRIKGRVVLIWVILAAAIAAPWIGEERIPPTSPLISSPASAPPAANAEPESPAPNVKPVIPALSSLNETIARPLFSATRRPPAPETAPKPAPAKTRPARLVGYRLTGIVRSSSHRLILLTEEKSGRVVELREGEQVDGWRLTSIGTDNIRLSRDGIEFNLLEAAAPPPVTRGRDTRWLPSGGDKQ